MTCRSAFSTQLLRNSSVAAIALSLLIASSVGLATTDASFQTQVIARVGASCQSVVANTLDFGVITSSAALVLSQTDAMASLLIDCTNGTAFTIVASSGANASGQQRRMRIDSTGVYMNYGIYTTSARTTTYPTAGTAQSGISDSAVQAIAIFGRVPAQTMTNSGTFADTLTFTVTY